MRRSTRPASLVALLGSALLASGLATAVPAAADHTDAPTSVTLAGSLQSELGCPADWDPACTQSQLTRVGDTTQYELVATLPAGPYEWKIAVDGSWDENYGAGGQNGANLPLVAPSGVELRFTYDAATHALAVGPTEGPPTEPTDEDRALAGISGREDLTRERFYFAMADRFANGEPGNDTGGLTGSPLETGYDPTATGFYHGGDLRGIIDRLDYIEGLGTTAIWLTPSFKNRPVQGAPGQENAGYHGYWITDFTQIDPHLGSNADMAELVETAHARGIKVFFDIITNHTADVIGYDPSEYAANGTLPYVSKAAEPYRDAAGNPFDDREYADGDPAFPEVDLDSFPYRPVVAPGDEAVKVPFWLNDPTLYHNRGTSTFTGEDSEYGDFPSGSFSALDDLWTEHPTVVQGMIDVYETWVEEAGIDGFRIDTVKHVNMEFWQQFGPALQGYAASLGNDDFFMFGEVYDSNPAFVSQYTTKGRLQAAVDFGFQGSATGFAKGGATTGLRDFFASDDWYTDGDSNVYSLPTFLGNHDMGRIGSFLRNNEEGWSEDELLQRDQLAHSLMYLSRGQPVVYYGDEQGFSAPPDVEGGVGDQRAREDMFGSQVPLYNSYDLIGTDATTAEENYDPEHPLYQHIAELSALREEHPTLADGAQVHRYASSSAGVYAFSRIDAEDRVEYVVATNNAAEAKTVTFPTYSERMRFRGLWSSTGEAPDAVRADREGRITVTVPAGAAMVWQARRAVAAVDAPAPVFATPLVGGTVGGRAEVGVTVPGNPFVQVTFAWRPVGTSAWQPLGTDDNAPYRIFHDVNDLPKGTLVEYRAIVGQGNASDELEVASTSAVVGDPPTPAPPGGGGPVVQPGSVSLPGSYNSEVGCPGDWQPECPVIDLALDEEDLVWSTTFGDDEPAIPAGGYAYKAAIDDAWDENYGAGGARNGPDIALAATGQPITFWYSHATHWVTNSLETPHLFTAAGSFQSELGCPEDYAPDCLRSWLQDPDGDGTWTFRTEDVPPGDYVVKVAQDQAWDVNWGAGGVPGGADIGFSVGPAEGVLMTFDEATHVLTVTTFPAQTSTGPDLTQQRAHWLSRDVIAMDVPDPAPGWTYRLAWAADGGLAVDAEAVLGGESAPLTRLEGGLPDDLAAAYPHLASYDAFEVPRSVRRDAGEILQGQVALAVFDELGRVVDATGVQVPGVLDDLYGGAADEALGVTWDGAGRPTVAVWAPTARDVDLLVRPAGAGADTLVELDRDGDGIWWARGPASWAGASYAFEVDVFVPSTGAVETNVVTDPYALALTTDSARSVMVDLSDESLAPRGWDRLRKPDKAQPEDTSIYELHIRDFSITDETVPAEYRGTYLAFTDRRSDGMQHLRGLARAGMTDVHLLPAFDFATVPERREDQAVPACDLPSLPPASDQQQACTTAVAAEDGFNWGYDPWHYTTPEGSYATDPEGATRTREFRSMVAGLNEAGLRVVMDVVYNHTTASGQDPKSVLDRVVPGYYHRLDPTTGEVETSTCCANTATEHRMMEKLMVDSVVTWARDYKVDGFRFDLMGHHSKDNMLAVRAALDELTVRKDGVDGSEVYVYGEGWNFGEVADDARFVQATQKNMAGTGIGTFSDRLRDAVRGGGPFDEDPRIQGFGSGLAGDPNGAPANGTPEEQAARLLLYHDHIKVGLAGNLADYSFVDRTGATVTGSQVDYNGQPAGYAADPSETVTYVDAHDNETLFDALQYKLPQATSMDDRVRMNTLSLSTTAFSQGVSFWHAGTDLLRSKSLDRNSYDSGDWFNRIDWSYEESTWGSGLPPQGDNAAKRVYAEPLLADPALEPAGDDIEAAHEAALELLEIRDSSPLFRLGTAERIQQRVGFPIGGPDQIPGVVVMTLDDRSGRDLDRRWERVVVVWNATPSTQSVEVDGASSLRLHPVQRNGSDPVVRQTAASAAGVSVPARTVAVLVQR